MSNTRKRFYNALGIGITLLIWELAGQYMGDALLAPPSSVAGTFVELLFESDMVLKLIGSLQLALAGFGLACLIGMPLGAMMGRSAVIDALVHPWISMLVVTSVAAILPIYILLFGTGDQFRVAIIFTASVGYIVLTAYHGARGIDPKHIDVARAFSTGRVDTYRKVIMPALFPYLITGARLGLVHALRAMIVAEMFVISGYGGLIFHTGLDISTAPILAYLLLLMAVSLGANMVLQRIGQAAAPWYEARMQRA